MKKLKQRWGIESNFQLAVIFVVFAITGSASVWVAKPFLHWIGLDALRDGSEVWKPVAYWMLRLLLRILLIGVVGELIQMRRFTENGDGAWDAPYGLKFIYM